MFRKRKQPTPGFRMPPPYEPMTGEQAELFFPGVFPYCAMMQIAAADTIDDYVLCRGFDTRYNKFVDYAVGDPNKPGLAVAKPYGKRMAGAYQIGQIFPAILPLQTPNSSPAGVPWRVGQNPGVAATSQGHPANLAETVDEMKRTEGEFINWMLLDESGTATKIRFEIVTATPAASPPEALVTVKARSCAHTVVPGESGGQVTVYDRCGCYLDEPAGDLVGRCGYADYMLEDAASACEWQITALCCNECT